VKKISEPRPVILGAGLAGLSCAYRLATKGIRVIVLEKEARVGGLAASRESHGLHYDYGPHRFHSQRKHVIDLLKALMGDKLIIQKRRSEIYLSGKFFVYPLNTGNILKNMPAPVLLKCFYDYVLARVKSLFDFQVEHSFESWVVRRFGKTLYRIFFGTYTQKVLGLPPAQISKDWAKERIKLLSLWSVMEETVFASKNPRRAYANNFYYPGEGGIGGIAEALKQKIVESGSEILLNADIKSITCEESSRDKSTVRSVVFEHDGEVREEVVSRLMSTIPITSLPLLLDSQALLENRAVFEKIKFRSLIFAYLVLDMELFSDSQWIYLPEERFFSNRISEPKNFSKHDFPGSKTILCAEISCDYQGEKWNMDHEEVKRRVLEDIARMGSKKIGAENLIGCFCHKISHCYPVYTMNYKSDVQAALGLLGSFENLDCFGRNGSFKYGNMDDVIEMGLKAADNFTDKKQRV